MGGNALKNVPTRRYEADEYFSLTQEVLEKLKRAKTQAWRFDIIPAYHDKESFGDMDVLYATDDDIPFDVDTVQYIFNPTEIVRNTSVISFDYKGFQIDLIHSKTDEIEYALCYFSWNDCGNLIGKLAHQLGLKHGHSGLILPLRDANNKFHDIVLTNYHVETLHFLDLDYRKFEVGFNNLDEIFNFVAASRYYNPEWYKLENLNTIARVRDRKRETYKKFLEFGESWEGPRAAKIEDKSIYLPMILNHFRATDEFNVVMRDMALQKLAKEKFNGEIVSRISGLKDKELGGLIKFLRSKNEFTPEMVAYLSPKSIETLITQAMFEYFP